MHKINIVHFTIIGLIMAIASGITTILSSEKTEELFNGVREASTGGYDYQVSCVLKAGVKSCIATDALLTHTTAGHGTSLSWQSSDGCHSSKSPE